MKRALIPFLDLCLLAVSAFGQNVKSSAVTDVVHVNTAFEHLTVLEFDEPVAMAAAGSSAFQIERQANKVFVKPLKPGVSTDLFVWTESRRFSYELEAPGEVKNMNFAIDSPAPVPRPVPDSHEQMVQIADIMLTKALLGAERIDNSNIKDASNRITVRVEQTLESSNTLYVHYSIANLTRHSYRVPSPSVNQLLPYKPGISIPSLSHMQLSHSVVHRLGNGRRATLQVAKAEMQKQDLGPGEETRGVIAIREQFTGPTVLELSFQGSGDHNVTATFIR